MTRSTHIALRSTPIFHRLRRGVSCLAVAAAAAFLPQTGYGLNWDVTNGDNGTVSAGGGTWTNDGGNWNDGALDVFWSNGSGAVFGGVDAIEPDAYNVIVGSGISASTLTFNSSGYILSAFEPTTLTLTETAGSIQIATGESATIGTGVLVNRVGQIGISGGGLLNVGGSVSTVGNNLVIDGGTTVNVREGGSFNAGTSVIVGSVSGAGSNGTLLVSGGTVTTFNTNNNGNLVIGNTAGVEATVTITSGLIALDPTSRNGIRFGASTAQENAVISGTFNLNGGEVETRLIGEGAAPTGTGSLTSTFNFNGGLLRANGALSSSSSVFMGGLDVANVKQGGARFDSNGFGMTVAQALSHDSELGETLDGGVTKIGAGILRLTGINTYTGLTTITEGTIEYRRAEAAGAGGTFESGTVITGATVRLDPGGVFGAGTMQEFTEYFTLGTGGVLDNKTLDNMITGTIALAGDGTITTSMEAKTGSLIVAGEVLLNQHTLTVSPGTMGGVLIDGSISGGIQGSLAKSGEGLVIVSGTSNTYQGSTTVSAGTLQLSGTISETKSVSISGGLLQLVGSERINDLAAFKMSGGTLDTGGFEESLGSFTLEGTALIDLGTGASVLRFLDSSANSGAWSGTLSISNWSGSMTGGGLDQLFFGSSLAGLTFEQISMITFINPAGLEPGTYGAQMLPTGELVAVPEPGSVMALFGGLGMLGLARFRRRSSAGR